MADRCPWVSFLPLIGPLWVRALSTCRRQVVKVAFMEELAVLVRRAQSGNLSAFAGIVRRFRDMACGYAHSRLGDFQSAEDARTLPGIKDGIGDADGRLPYARPPHGRRTAPRCSLQCTLGPQRTWSGSGVHLRFHRWREAQAECACSEHRLSKGRPKAGLHTVGNVETAPGDGGPFFGTTACAHTCAIHHRLARSTS
jgi:hypothetical protein